MTNPSSYERIPPPQAREHPNTQTTQSPSGAHKSDTHPKLQHYALVQNPHPTQFYAPLIEHNELVTTKTQHRLPVEHQDEQYSKPVAILNHQVHGDG